MDTRNNAEALQENLLVELEAYIESIRKVPDNAPEHLVEAERHFLREQLFRPVTVAKHDPQASKAKKAMDELVPKLLAKRDEARSNKDWVKEDEIRDLLTSSGVTVEDSPSGTKWSIK